VDNDIEVAVKRAISTMHERICEGLTIDDLARTAIYSKFHFSRAFRQVTGVSPGRFLTALRFQEAKRLLLSTSLSVAEISNRVGYSSLGTFSTRFKHSVGVTPTQYRRSGGFRPRLVDAGRSNGGGPFMAIYGRILPAPGERPGPTFAGLFPDSVPLGPPLRCTSLESPGPYVLRDVPTGTWYVLAYSVTQPASSNGARDHTRDRRAGYGGANSRHTGPGDHDRGDRAGQVVGSYGPIPVESGLPTGPVDVQLRQVRTVDVPVLLAPLEVGLVAVGADDGQVPRRGPSPHVTGPATRLPSPPDDVTTPPPDPPHRSPDRTDPTARGGSAGQWVAPA
jgi:AraC-like DNA-binding protein